MTERLYNIDAYIREFDAVVLESYPMEDGFVSVLNKSAFFPEGGGQSSDKGDIDGVRVFDVKEVGGKLLHYTKEALNVNKTVHCSIDFEERFEKMQCHTAEHIASGFFHSLYGMDNVGFHLGDDFVTFDTSGVLTDEMLYEVERLANEAVYKNVDIRITFPDAKDLPSLEYRSKLDITENVRIVTIDGIDACACCAPHVAKTGEVGIIKFIECKKHRGSSRITMLAGARAYRYINEALIRAHRAAEMLSAPILEIDTETERTLSAKADMQYKLSVAGRKLASLLASTLEKTDKNKVVYLPLLDMDGLREFVNEAAVKVSGALVALCGEEGNYKYVIGYGGEDFNSLIKNANAALVGKGGGRAPMAQGSYSSSLSEIEKYFS